MIKDIGPPVDESDAGTGGSRRARNERQPIQKPWGKKDATPKQESARNVFKDHAEGNSDSISASSSVIADEDKKDQKSDATPQTTKKISSATKKRLEALKVKKEEATPQPV